MWKHPKYYKELRKRNKSDQIISPRVATASARRASGPGQQIQATSSKQQAPSRKLQALKLQATSIKPQATSVKLQAASDKLSNLQALIKFQATSIRGLNANETILRMTYMEGNLVW